MLFFSFIFFVNKKRLILNDHETMSDSPTIDERERLKTLLRMSESVTGVFIFDFEVFTFAQN